MTSEALLDGSISATSFSADAGAGDLPARVAVAVVGGGIIGTSTALHLAEMGLTDVLVIERSAVAAGTTWHAAGLLARVRGSHALTELANYGVDRYSQLEADSGVEVGFFPSGSLTIARTEGRMDECRYTAAMARHHGIDARMLSPIGVLELWPAASMQDVLGGLHIPGDATVNPGRAALAFAKLAHERGVTIREGVRVTGIGVSNRRATHVDTDHGRVHADAVVLCAGMWTRDLAASIGVHVPLYAAEHVHATSAPTEAAVRTLPILRDLDRYLYIRHYRGRFLVGAFEPDGRPRPMDTIDDDFSFGEFGADWEHFAQVRRNAELTVPGLQDIGFEHQLRAPESFTPDVNFCLGEAAEAGGVFVGAGFNSQGIIFGPGAGRALAEWIVEGAPTFDAAPVDVSRFARTQSVRRYLHERTREGLGRLYAMHWPHLQPERARGVRRTPLFDRLVAANACFGEAAGWERANWFAPDGVQPRYEYSFGRQNWFHHVEREHRAARESVAIFDLSSFAKVLVEGRDALCLLQRVCTADIDVPAGKIAYTLMLNRLGGIELDGTVTRLAGDRFLVVTPTAYQYKTLHWIERHRDRHEHAAVVDVTSGMATIGVMGPRSRALLQELSPSDLSNDAFPWGRSKEIEIADAFALALRLSFVGELGWELYVPTECALNVYDAIVEVGDAFQLRRAGYHALDSLRLEKGYRHLGHDIGPADTPAEAGLMHAVAKKKELIGGDALAARCFAPPERQQVFVKLEEPDPLLLHGESIILDRRVCGHVTSGAYGFTVHSAVGIGFVDHDAVRVADTEPTTFAVDVMGRSVPATVRLEPFYDPRNVRLRS